MNYIYIDKDEPEWGIARFRGHIAYALTGPDYMSYPITVMMNEDQFNTIKHIFVTDEEGRFRDKAYGVGVGVRQ